MTYYIVMHRPPAARPIPDAPVGVLTSPEAAARFIAEALVGIAQDSSIPSWESAFYVVRVEMVSS